VQKGDNEKNSTIGGREAWTKRNQTSRKITEFGGDHHQMALWLSMAMWWKKGPPHPPENKGKKRDRTLNLDSDISGHNTLD